MLKYSLLFCFLLLLHNSCFSQTYKPATNPETVLSDLKKTSQSTNSIQANFTEEKHVAVLKEAEKSSGVFYYKKNDKMRWEQNTPFKYVILINGDKLRIQDAGKEKSVAAAGRMAAQIKELMIGLVNGDFQEDKAFKQSVLENSDHYQIELVPLNKRLKNYYTKINLVFSRNTLRLKELTFFEKGGDKSVMKFQNEKFNQPIAEGIFLNF